MHLVENALTDAPGRGRNSEISNEEKPGLWMRPAANRVIWLCSGNLDSYEIDEPTQLASYAFLPA